MKRLLPALFALCVMPAFADYFSDRTAGMELFNAGKFQEAADGFLKLGESKNDIQQADALTNAAICLQRMQRADEAMALAGKIRSEPMAMACRIGLLRNGRQWAELLKLAEAQDFTVWPAKLLADQKAWDQALAEVALLEKAQNKDPYWICSTQLAYGYIYEKQGSPALESYRNAAAVPKAPDKLVKAANAKIAALEGAAPGGTPAVFCAKEVSCTEEQPVE